MTCLRLPAPLKLFVCHLPRRDLKAENVLMVSEGCWVLCDFGSATTRAQVYTTVEEIAAEEDVIRKHTTPAYRAPEVGLPDTVNECIHAEFGAASASLAVRCATQLCYAYKSLA